MVRELSRRMAAKPPTRRTLPARSSRPVPNSLQDGFDSDELDEILASTMASPEKSIPRLRHIRSDPAVASRSRSTRTLKESSSESEHDEEYEDDGISFRIPKSLPRRSVTRSSTLKAATISPDKRSSPRPSTSGSSLTSSPTEKDRLRFLRARPVLRKANSPDDSEDSNSSDEERDQHSTRSSPRKRPYQTISDHLRNRLRKIRSSSVPVHPKNEERKDERKRRILKPIRNPKTKGKDEEEVSSSDEDFDRETLSKAKTLVMDRYGPIVEENNKEMEEILKSKIREPLMNGTLPLVRYRTIDDSKPIPLVFSELPRKADRFASSARYPDGSKSRPVPVIFIPATAPLPRMKYWVHVDQNVKTEDNLRLSHIPYVDDDHDSAAFCRDLNKAYPDGIHGTRTGWNKHISDYLLYLLLGKVIPEWESTGHEMRYLFRAIYKLFPNKLSVRQLEHAFTSLELRFDPRALAEKSFDANKKEDMYHSISTMMCVKCLQFHCLLHGVYADGEEFRMHRIPKTKSRHHPCGVACYLNLAEIQELENPHGAKRHSPRKRSSNVTNFSGFALLAFQKTVQNNRNTFCQIARMMQAIAPNEPKTCQEIYQLAQRVPPPERERSPEDIMRRKISIREQQSSFRNFTWSNGKGTVDNSEQPYACRHAGPCGQTVDDCYCGQHNTLCSKYCCCGPDCKMRFPGCRCQPGACRTKQCQCFYAKWECDPDVCKSCNCGPYFFSEDEDEEPYEPIIKLEEDEHEHDDDLMSIDQDDRPIKERGRLPICSNVNIQRGNHKKLLIGVSDVAGYGCFINESAEKGEFIAEYTGEVISKWEAERRGRVYDEFKCSYIFALNKDQSIDATRFGNLIRFANHSDKYPNCYSQIIMVNGEHRIGIFAKRKLDAGDELLFDYQYDKKWKEQYVPVEISRKTHEESAQKSRLISKSK